MIAFACLIHDILGDFLLIFVGSWLPVSVATIPGQ